MIGIILALVGFGLFMIGVVFGAAELEHRNNPPK